MRRPPGVPQAPRSPSPGEPGRTTPGAAERTAPAAPKTSAAARGPRKKAAVGAAGAPTGSGPDATTEPITVVSGPAARAEDPVARTTGAAQSTAPSTPASDDTAPRATPAADPPAATRTPGLLARLNARRAASGTGVGAGSDAEVRDAPLTPRSARKRLRAARRARKLYERSEVRRFTSRSRRRRNLWIAAIGTAAALVAFVLVGVYSPLMALRTIEVTGTERIPATDIVQALDGQLDTPLPLIDFAAVKQELSEFTLIRSYVTESRPPHTLVVRIVERNPVGSIASADGFDLVDAAGVVISSGAERTPQYPVVDAAGGASGAGFEAAVAVIAALPEGIRSQLDTVTAATKDDVTLTLGGGARVVWGNSERAEYKAVVLSALLVAHPVGSVTEYDVSSPDSAVVR
jgi:cell division protein FtsQ